jgi:hypothetical protein
MNISVKKDDDEEGQTGKVKGEKEAEIKGIIGYAIITWEKEISWDPGDPQVG